MGEYSVSLGIAAYPQHSYDVLLQRALSELGDFQENKANEGPREYCGYRTERGRHVGLHVKDGLAYRIEISPQPPASSPIWGPIMSIIRRYP